MNIFQQLFRMAESALQFDSLSSGVWQFLSTYILRATAATRFGCGWMFYRPVKNLLLKAKFHYAILVADRFEAGRRPAASWSLAYHLVR